MTRKRVENMVGRVAAFFVFALVVICCATQARSQGTNEGRISGRVGVPGVNGAGVWLFDAKTGSPIAAKIFRPLIPEILKDPKADLAFAYVLTDAQGRFSFTNLPAGEYRLIAQSWTGDDSMLTGKPFSRDGKRPDTMELYGTAENITVPSPQAEQVQVNPLGKGALDLTFRYGSLVFVSTKPLAADPALGLLSLSSDWASHLIGIGALPEKSGNGRFRISGLPETNVHVMIFVNDNAPGFGAADFAVLPKTPQEIPIVAGWSDGYKIPPPRIQHIIDVLETNHLRWVDVVKPKKVEKPKPESLQVLVAMKESLGPLDRVVELPNGEKATVGDVYAADLYAQLRDAERKR